MKKIHINDLTHLKSPADIYWPFNGTLKVKADKPYRYDSANEQITDRLENDPTPDVWDWPLIKGIDKRNCGHLDYKHLWIPCTKDGEEVELIID